MSPNIRVSNSPSDNPAVYEITQSPPGQASLSELELNFEHAHYSPVAPASNSRYQQPTSFYDGESTSSSYERLNLSQTIQPDFKMNHTKIRELAENCDSSTTEKYHRKDKHYASIDRLNDHFDDDPLLRQSELISGRFYGKEYPIPNRSSHMPRIMGSLSPNDDEFHRHPNLRPLPKAPEQNEEDDQPEMISPIFIDRQKEQEKLIAEIGDALRSSSLRRERPIAIHQSNGDISQNELLALQHSQSRDKDLINESITASLDSPFIAQETYFDDIDNSDDENESDFEAAAGLEAMRIADEQDLYCCNEIPNFGNHDKIIDNHQEIMDLTSAAGDYDIRISYGQDIPIKNTMEFGTGARKLDIKLNLSHDMMKSRSNDSFSLPGRSMTLTEPIVDEKNYFSSSEGNNTELYDTARTQSLVPKPHRMSFDEGDEEVSLYSRSFHKSEGNDLPPNSLPELFYHPGMRSSAKNRPGNYERPLPPIPLLDDKTIQGMILGQHQRNWNIENSLIPNKDSQNKSSLNEGLGTNGLQKLSNRVGVNISRASSLLNQGTIPYTAPPVRSKTDAEERQLRNKVTGTGMNITSGLDNYNIGSPQSLHAIDLPSLPIGRHKKFSASRLSSKDFQKCKEPWALSSIASWIKHVAGSETGEGEADLKTKAIEEGLVALFTHIVPTMNTADAETLSQRVSKSMLDSGLLVQEEEWVKFGNGEVSGVLWQLTGSGCYSPKVHENEVHGRCYSYHCTRTLKKLNFQSKVLEPSRVSEDWMTFHKLTAEQLEGVKKKEIQRQNNLHEIVMSEDLYMDQINVLRVLYRDELSSWEPSIIAKEKLSKFVSAVFGKVQAIKAVNESYLLAQLKYRQKEQGPWITGFSDIFREWIRKAKLIYIEYAAGFPHACYLVRREADRNLLFRQFLDQARDNKLSGRLDWNTYLKAPITRLQRYSLLLGTVLSNMTQESEEKSNLILAIEEIKAVTLECDTKVDENTKKVEMLELRSKLILRPGMNDIELNLDHLGRKLIFQGDLLRVGANRFTWLETHAILLDNYLVLAKTIAKGDSIYGRKKEGYDVSKHPIPMQLLILESTTDDPVIKSSVKGITAVAKTGPINAINLGQSRSTWDVAERNIALEFTSSNQSTTQLSSIPRTLSISETDTRLMYPFRVKHLGKAEVYTLYAPSAQNRMEWCDKILQAKIQFTASLHEQNAEPFRLRVMADCAFALDTLSMIPQKNSVSVTGTPLDRAIREIENDYGAGPRPGPICRTAVNCATSFNFYGKTIVAIGSDNGVFVSAERDPRGWTRSIMVSRVTQIAVLEEFSICLIIADKALIAYSLDMVMPNSEFSVPPQESVRRAPMKLSGTRDVSFFATSRMKNRTLIFYKKREGLHSTFKVLEPVFQKSSEKKSRLLGRIRGGSTDFFRAYDEFYIPTECYSINIFHSYIAISTLKGFELMTLDKKLPMSIPDTKDPAIASVTARISGLRPLGMFRLSNVEFLLCYEECGVYIDKHGDVSRSVIMEFVGKAKNAAMYGAYLVLFDTDFIEVRNADNGRLRQVISGKDIKCLDSGVSPLGTGATLAEMEKRTLKFVMAHPEISSSQLVLEMELTKGYCCNLMSS
ncbi:putative rho1 guanine nucleotide exchange factor 1 [Erysiphe necator]|uniref:Putative rho1 guanine nucleotide exchange factor 1 n=1 Tax=Uncinula necator TaxID=52586 RepID=A0A0B1P917_UNCNE|nr:putative rho1 guanine nucleotide exchange factor 1 [Erysiphe necator]